MLPIFDFLNLKYPFALLTVSVFLLSCSKNPDVEVTGEPLFSTSFEMESDTAGWAGVIPHLFVNQAPENGGKKSLRVSGGCLQPAAQLSIGPFAEDCRLQLTFSAKKLFLGGSVVLRSDKEHIRISVSDDNWTNYVSPQSILCAKGSKVYLELSAGGLVGREMLIDLIEISKVD